MCLCVCVCALFLRVSDMTGKRDAAPARDGEPDVWEHKADISTLISIHEKQTRTHVYTYTYVYTFGAAG